MYRHSPTSSPQLWTIFLPITVPPQQLQAPTSADRLPPSSRIERVDPPGRFTSVFPLLTLQPPLPPSYPLLCSPGLCSFSISSPLCTDHLCPTDELMFIC